MLRSIAKTISPFIFSILLIGGAIFGYLLPKLKETIVVHKIAMVESMAQSAWSILAALDHKVQAGELTLEEAQSQGKSIIHSMRYDDAGRDYFWIINYNNVPLVHPYRPDHVGKDLSELADKTGKKFIAEMVRTAREKGQGLVTYYWQVTNDTESLELKYSYSKDFKPWQRVVGTGEYMADVV